MTADWAQQESEELHRQFGGRRLLHSNKRHPGGIQAMFFERLAFGLSDCWYWAGQRNHDGYGIIYGAKTTYGQKDILAHRLSWRFFRGDIPAGCCVLHKCDVPGCVNPAHLFIGTQADNVYDMVSKKRHLAFPRAGESNIKAKLDRNKVRAIRSLYATGTDTKYLASRFMVNRSTIYKIIRNQTWTQ
jgi:hypothetical protein